MAETEIKSINGRTLCDNQARSDIKELENMVVKETDPTVPAWAKQPNKPSYTANEVGALPSTTKIPTKTSELNNDSGYLTDEELSGKGYATQTVLNELSEELTEHIENDLDWFDKGTSIPENADLDTYQTLGKFYCSSESRAKTLDNCPTTTNFSMWVFDRTGYKSQLIITLGGKMYTRSRDSSKWRAWIAYTTSDEIVELTASIKEELLTEVEAVIDECAIQPDWTQNDATKPDYIKNKPFGDIVSYTEVYEEVFVQLEVDEFGSSYATLPLNGWYPVVGKEYALVIDDKEYICEVYDDGNGNIEIYDSSRDIRIFILDEIDMVLNTSLDFEETCRFAIFESQVTVNKLDKKYLSDVNWSEIKDKPFGEIEEKIVVYDEVTVNLEWDDMEGRYATLLPLNEWSPIVGEEYTLVFSDKKYKCEVYSEDGAIYLYECDKNTAESAVVIWFIPDEQETFNLFSNEGGEYTFSIIIPQVSVKKIDEKFLPNTIDLEVTYEDGTKGTLVLFGEVQ